MAEGPMAEGRRAMAEGRKPKVLFSVVADRLNRTAFHRLFAKALLILAVRLLDHKRMSVFRMHSEMVGSRQDAGVTSNAFPIDEIASGNIFFKFLGLVGHAGNLKQSARAVILSFAPKDATPFPL